MYKSLHLMISVERVALWGKSLMIDGGCLHCKVLFPVQLNFMTAKQISTKQAEKWLDKLKTQNPQSYRDITKFLRKYEKTEDQYECYVKISHTLLAHSELTKDLNNYMDDPNRFIIPKPDEEKIKELMSFVKRNRPEIFDKIIHLIQELSKSKGENPQQMSKLLKPRLKEIIEGDTELERITEEALECTGEELINRKNLEYLKLPKQSAVIIEEEKDISRQPVQKIQQERGFKGADGKAVEPLRRGEPRGNIVPSNPVDQRTNFKQFEKSVDEQTFQYVIKIIKIYYLNIITRNQAFELLSKVQADEDKMDGIRETIDTRESDRRRLSVFRPLNDMNFSNAERPSPSYVSLPLYYPIKCSGKTFEISKMTNDKWVSVPYGSQESQNFSVRNKNQNQSNLLKAEDERYEFDIYMKRLEKTLAMLDRILDDKKSKSENECEQLVSRVVSMGVVQLIYKMCSKDFKQQIQGMLKLNTLETCKVFRERIYLQINQLKGIKQIHANKNWSQIAVKNFFKALDLKGFQFKKNQKQKMKGTFFISELQQKSKIIQNGGQIKNNMITFQDKKQFFTVFNSFESSSRTEKCNHRTLPEIESFDLKDQKRRHFYPLMILAFEDQSVCQILYSLLIFYIDNFQIPESQKLRCKLFLQQYLVGFLGWKLPIKKYLNQNFDQDKLYGKISKTGEQQLTADFKNWITVQKQAFLSTAEQKDEQNIKMGFLTDRISEYSYLPAKSDDKVVLFGSEHLYTLNRFIYALYERLIKMREVTDDLQKIELFQILFYACIKAKQGIKFQQNLNILFGKHAYLFSTLYKLLDNLVKSLSITSNCPIVNFSFKYMKQPSEDLYQVLMNRFYLASNCTNSKILRLTYNKSSKVIYFNYFDSYYKNDETGKDIVKKRQDISKGIQIYTIDSFGLLDKKRRKPNDLYQRNELQYIFQGSTIKMLNHAEREDLLYHSPRRTNMQKMMKRQLKRTHKLISRTY